MSEYKQLVDLSLLELESTNDSDVQAKLKAMILGASSLDDIIALVLNQKADIDDPGLFCRDDTDRDDKNRDDSAKQSPLWFLVESFQTSKEQERIEQLVSLLINLGADVNALSSDGESLMSIAVKSKSLKIVRSIAESGRFDFDDDFNQNDLLKLALENFEPGIFSYLCHHPKLNINNGILEEAIAAKNFEAVSILCSSHFLDFNKAYERIFSFAVEHFDLKSSNYGQKKISSDDVMIPIVKVLSLVAYNNKIIDDYYFCDIYSYEKDRIDFIQEYFSPIISAQSTLKKIKENKASPVELKKYIKKLYRECPLLLYNYVSHMMVMMKKSESFDQAQHLLDILKVILTQPSNNKVIQQLFMQVGLFIFENPLLFKQYYELTVLCLNKSGVESIEMHKMILTTCYSALSGLKAEPGMEMAEVLSNNTENDQLISGMIQVRLAEFALTGCSRYIDTQTLKRLFAQCNDTQESIKLVVDHYISLNRLDPSKIDVNDFSIKIFELYQRLKNPAETQKAAPIVESLASSMRKLLAPQNITSSEKEQTSDHKRKHSM